jgi:arylsulfatase A
VFHGEATSSRTTLVSHSISGHFAIRQGDWKLCLAAGSGGWSAPREGDAQKQKLPTMQLFNLAEDKAEQKNLLTSHPERAQQLLSILQSEVNNGRCTPGAKVSNDREITFLPKGVTIK